MSWWAWLIVVGVGWLLLMLTFLIVFAVRAQRTAARSIHETSKRINGHPTGDIHLHHKR